MPRSLLCLLLLGACQREAAVPKSPAVKVPFSAAAPPSQEPACALLLERHRERLLARPEAPQNCLAITLEKPDGPFTCQTSASGTWAFIASHDAWLDWQKLEAGADCMAGAPALRLSLVYRALSGAEAERAGFTHYADMHGGGSVELETIFDYDGDGNAEAIVNLPVDGEGSFSDDYTVYGVTSGNIVPYAPAAALPITGVGDTDRDQRPDLLIAAHRAQTSNSGIEGLHTAVEGLAHSVEGGGFALDDEATRTFALGRCGAKSYAGVVARKGENRDDVATGHAIVCARQRGVSERTVLDELDRACPSWSEDLEVSPDPENAPPTQPCPQWWKRWLEELRSAPR